MEIYKLFFINLHKMLIKYILHIIILSIHKKNSLYFDKTNLNLYRYEQLHTLWVIAFIYSETHPKQLFEPFVTSAFFTNA